MQIWNDFHEGKSLYLKILRNRRQRMLCRATWGGTQIGQETRGERKGYGPDPLLKFWVGEGGHLGGAVS